MKRRSRQIESSEVALMAVVTKAMGAFLILMIFGFKYYIEDANGRRETESALEQLQSAQQALDVAQEWLEQRQQKEGDVSQEDYDAALLELEKIRENLRQVMASIAELKARLDQTLSQNNRLRDELALVRKELEATSEELASKLRLLETLEAEKRRLMAELERFKQPLVVLRLRIDKADGALFKLDFSRQQLDPNSDLSLEQIPKIPTNETGAYGYSAISKADSVDGYTSIFCEHYDWPDGNAFLQHIYLRDTMKQERFALYIKLLNALPGGRKAYSGTLEMSFRGVLSTIRFTITEADPFDFVALIDLKGRQASAPSLSEAERNWFRDRIVSAPAAPNLSCQPFDPQLRSALIQLVMSRLRPELVPENAVGIGASIDLSPAERTRGEAMLRKLAEGIADQSLHLDTIAKWTPLLAISSSRVVNAGVSKPTAAKEESLRTRLQTAAVPEPMIQEYIDRIRDGWWSLGDVHTRLEKLGVAEAKGSFLERIKKYGLPPWYATELDTNLSSERISESKAIALLDAIQLDRMSPPKPPIDRNTHPKVIEIRSELERMGFTKAFANLTLQWIVTGQLTLEDACNILLISNQSSLPNSKEQP